MQYLGMRRDISLQVPGHQHKLDLARQVGLAPDRD